MRRKRILAVVHVADYDQAIRNVDIANDAGCDGAFLISHGACNWRRLIRIARDIKYERPIWIGINCLDLSPYAVFGKLAPRNSGDVPEPIDGVWSDTCNLDEDWWDLMGGLEIEYFGGFAFKYQPQPADLAESARRARRRMSTICTSGTGTGVAADIEKIKVIRSAIGDFPLAVASGITPENVVDYLPYVDDFLVATGISKDFHELDPARTKELVTTVRAYECR